MCIRSLRICILPLLLVAGDLSIPCPTARAFPRNMEAFPRSMEAFPRSMEAFPRSMEAPAGAVRGTLQPREEGIAAAGGGDSLQVQRSACFEAAVDDDGHRRFAVVWSRRSNRQGRIEGVVCAAFTMHRAIRVLTQPKDGEIDVRPAVCWIDTSAQLLVWQRTSATGQRILGRVLSSDGLPSGEVFEVSARDGAALPASPSVQRLAPGTALIAWQEAGRILVREYRQPSPGAGSPSRRPQPVPSLGPITPIPPPTGGSLAGVPAISSGNRGTAWVFRIDNRLGGRWSFIATPWHMGRPLPFGRDILIDSVQEKDMTIIGHAAWIDSRRACLVWKDYREGDSNIYLRLLESRTGALTPALRVNSDPGSRWQRLPDLDTWPGAVVVCWEDYRNAEGNQQGDIYARVISVPAQRGRPPRMTAIPADDVQISAGDERRKRKQPRIATNGADAGLIVWYAESAGSLEVFGRWISPPLQPRGGEFSISIPPRP